MQWWFPLSLSPFPTHTFCQGSNSTCGLAWCLFYLWTMCQTQLLYFLGSYFDIIRKCYFPLFPSFSSFAPSTLANCSSEFFYPIFNQSLSRSNMCSDWLAGFGKPSSPLIVFYIQMADIGWEEMNIFLLLFYCLTFSWTPERLSSLFELISILQSVEKLVLYWVVLFFQKEFEDTLCVLCVCVI